MYFWKAKRLGILLTIISVWTKLAIKTYEQKKITDFSKKTRQFAMPDNLELG